jgi:hypothetical protein
MSDWTFEVDDGDSGTFSVWRTDQSKLTGRYQDVTGRGVKVVGGIVEVEEDPTDLSYVLVSLSNGHVARFDPIENSNSLQYVGIV